MQRLPSYNPTLYIYPVSGTLQFLPALPVVLEPTLYTHF